MRAIRSKSRQRLDTLFLAHMISAVVVGAICLVKPRLFLLFLHETLPMNQAGYEVSETIIRLYGSLIFAQAILVKNTRASSDPTHRRSFVRAYAVAFGLTSASLLYAQWIEHFSIYNWANILFFLALCACYSYFVFFEKFSTFALGNDVDK
jgi:Ca2+/Na+ antiporter